MRKYIPLLISGLLMIAVGIYMLLSPDGFLSVVISIFGLYLIINGARAAFILRQLRDMLRRAFTPSLCSAIASIVMGIAVIAVAVAFPMAVPVFLIYIVAFVFAFAGAMGLVDLLLLSKVDSVPPSLALETVLSFVFALVLFMFPSFLTGVVMTLFAAILLASGAVMVYGAISSMFFQRKLDRIGRDDTIMM